ncbi:ABC transporter ATP-binding protein [Paenibacillus harenae]|uniref:ABC transporter ATP-binding protein n=1 Tax=Paenibacillus harenae TaxID=306543 RepID=UPI00278CBFB8|nr:ABC transporter ATP-binding protein [Paenibacillus harenae]MDQ0063162.1 ABC-type multidrug transport system fused ATPase/permease subunit [Paenibacillus harenae]
MFELLTNCFAAKELRIYRLAPAFLKEWGEYYWKNAHEQRKVDRKSISTRSGIDGWNTLSLLAYSVYVLWVCYSKKLSLGTFVAVSQIIVSTQSQMKNVAYSLSQFYAESMIIQQFFTFMDTEEERTAHEELEFAGKVQEGITVNNLSFAYPGSTKPALKNISFCIKANETVAVVGDNGAGKSTLIHCLIGLHQSYEGSITYDDVDLKEINVASFKKRVSAVFQDYVHYHGSIKENIGFGNVELMDNLSAIEAAAGLSGASEFISRLHNGYDALVGAGFQNAQELSIGQWQKLALGMAYFNDGSIVVLDEPTASLDPNAESELYRQFKRLSEGKVTFLVSHRLGSCRIADWILVLKQGELIEQGTHDELMKLGGDYKQMYESQVEWYLPDESCKGA